MAVVLEAIWNPAGGLRYHVRARARREQAWAPFRASLERWFDRWTPEARTLAIVGPSGGYCLPLTLVARFERLICFEPDPIARWVLARRLKQLPSPPQLTFVAHDVWIAPLLHGGSVPMLQLQHDTAILFSNFIGQLTYLVRDPDWPRFTHAWQASLFPLLERVPWASFHDRVSGRIAPVPDRLPESTPRRLDDAQVVELYDSGRADELLDHRSHELLPAGKQYGYLHWPLLPDQQHLIECVIGRD